MGMTKRSTWRARTREGTLFAKKETAAKTCNTGKQLAIVSTRSNDQNINTDQQLTLRGATITTTKTRVNWPSHEKKRPIHKTHGSTAVFLRGAATTTYRKHGSTANLNTKETRPKHEKPGWSTADLNSMSNDTLKKTLNNNCLLYTSPSPRD